MISFTVLSLLFKWRLNCHFKIILIESIFKRPDTYNNCTDCFWFSYVWVFIIHWVKFKLLSLDTNTYVKNVFDCQNYQKNGYVHMLGFFHIFFLSFQHLFIKLLLLLFWPHLPIINDQKVSRNFLKYNFVR